MRGRNHTLYNQVRPIGTKTDTAVRFLTSRVAVVPWRGYVFIVSQVRWGRFRRWLYANWYRHTCPPPEVRYETAVFLSHADGRYNPQKPLHATFQKNGEEARVVLKELTTQLADGRLAFQSFFLK
jgi:hypothetical protein